MCPRSRSALMRLAIVVLALAPVACRSPAVSRPHVECCSPQLQPATVEAHEDAARAWAKSARRASAPAAAGRASLLCAAHAYDALKGGAASSNDMANLATRCTDDFMAYALTQNRSWSEGPLRVAGTELSVEFRQLSPYLVPPLDVTLAREVSMELYRGKRFSTDGFGVPLAILGRRCEDAPVCSLLPPEGVFRGATAWIETDAHGSPVLVLSDPLRAPQVTIGASQYLLASDTSAAWARGAQTSKLHRLGVWGLFGGREVGRRAGVFLLEDYDPDKKPLVMIHGLGSSPLMWAGLSNEIWGDAALRSRYQVWHVVYQTNAPLLVNRLRVQGYLDAAWKALDPEGDDFARSNMVLVGHSLGGVVARMLCSDSGDVLWNAAFVTDAGRMHAAQSDLAIVDATFHFKAYPGVGRAIFLAAPHRGSPAATRWFGRVARVLVGRRAPEIQSLRRVAQANPEAVQPELLDRYLRGWVNSISTLQSAQPVRAAGERLMPRKGIAYHTIAGALPRYDFESDGVVPVASTLLDGAQSTLVVRYGHDLEESPEALAEISRILHEDVACGPGWPGDAPSNTAACTTPSFSRE